MHIFPNLVTFADDVALYAETRSAFEIVGMSFVEVVSQWGLTDSLAKTKGLAVRVETEEDGTASVRAQGGVIDMVDDFIYVDSSDGKIQLRCSVGLLRLRRLLGI